MEIEVPRRLVATVVALLVLLTLALIGLAVSPRDAGGHPLLLSPERRAVLHYQNRCRDWIHRLESLQSRLNALTPASVEDLQPAASPGDLYHRAQEAQRILDAVTVLRREIEQTRVPPTMTGVHALIAASVQVYYTWAETLSAYIGAPSPQGVQELNRLRQEAAQSLAQLTGILEPDEKAPDESD